MRRPHLRSALALAVILMLAVSISDLRAQTLEVYSPVGGEIWKEGEMRDIIWTTDGDPGMVKLTLETTDQWHNVQRHELTAIHASANAISWAIPNVGDTPVQARILIEGDVTSDASDATFTILPQGSLRTTANNRHRFELKGFYPNPAQDIVTFNWAPSVRSAVVAKIYNSSGAVVRTTSVSGNSTEMQVQINDLPQGSYFYELLTDGHIARGVLTIQR